MSQTVQNREQAEHRVAEWLRAAALTVDRLATREDAGGWLVVPRPVMFGTVAGAGSYYVSRSGLVFYCGPEVAAEEVPRWVAAAALAPRDLRARLLVTVRSLSGWPRPVQVDAQNVAETLREVAVSQAAFDLSNLEESPFQTVCDQMTGPFCLVWITLRGTKRYNGHNGFSAGDKLIADVGAAVESAALPNGTVVRSEGDSFAAAIAGDESSVSSRLQRIFAVTSAARDAQPARCSSADCSGPAAIRSVYAAVEMRRAHPDVGGMLQLLASRTDSIRAPLEHAVWLAPSL